MLMLPLRKKPAKNSTTSGAAREVRACRVQPHATMHADPRNKGYQATSNRARSMGKFRRSFPRLRSTDTPIWRATRL